MTITLEIVWGSAQHREDFPETERYSFETEAEVSAFLMGAECGLGYDGYSIESPDEYRTE